MIILRKKRFLILISCLVLSFSIYLAQTNTINYANRTYDITQVSSIPATRQSNCD
jgi:hypothetical protein